MKDLDSLIKKYLPEVIAFRHELHKIPELAGEEHLTSAFIRKKLAQIPGLEVKKPFLGTDVVALMGNPDLPNLTLRADIDALPVEEKTGVPYCSTRKGFMHACGHDGHSAMLYGAMLCISELQKKLNCSLRFLFQPGEEIRAMAKKVVEAGALENPAPAFVAGIHNWPNVPYGTISARIGAVMAAAGFFRIVITGKGGHGSMPKRAKNPLETAAKILTGTKQIIPEGCVLTVCALNGGSNSNVIPEHAELQGTIRFLDPAAGEKMIGDFRTLCEAICAEDQVTCEFDLNVPYPATINTAAGYETAKKCTEKYLGANAFTEMPESSMSSEDFAYYLQNYNGVFCHLGTGDKTANLHTDKFDFDDEILEYGIRFFVGLALEFNGESK
ncbi:MAG: amidohydrolase [Lentisphaeria bacterium]|nr:amidohydrolase [Lentisphaeria bacterium]